MSSDCLFCNISKERIILENDLAYAIHDGFPVTEMHSLVIPRRHIYDYFDNSFGFRLFLLSLSKDLHFFHVQ